MKLELIEILSNSGAVREFEGDAEFSREDLPDDVVFNEPVHIKGRSENIGGQVEISARVTARLDTVCARCMKEISEDVDFSFTERIAGKDTPEDDDVILLEGSEVDMADLALNNFITLSPMKYLCKEDCKGLCPHCGADRNQTECGCETDAVDPRFDVLNDLFR